MWKRAKNQVAPWKFWSKPPILSCKGSSSRTVRSHAPAARRVGKVKGMTWDSLWSVVKRRTLLGSGKERDPPAGCGKGQGSEGRPGRREGWGEKRRNWRFLDNCRHRRVHFPSPEGGDCFFGAFPNCRLRPPIHLPSRLVNINKPGRMTFWSGRRGRPPLRWGFIWTPPHNPHHPCPRVHAHTHLLDNRRDQNQYCICHPSVSFLLPRQPGCH